jgi:hypothetical protein
LLIFLLTWKDLYVIQYRMLENILIDFSEESLPQTISVDVDGEEGYPMTSYGYEFVEGSSSSPYIIASSRTE